jgi:peroxiredoxin
MLGGQYLARTLKHFCVLTALLFLFVIIFIGCDRERAATNPSTRASLPEFLSQFAVINAQTSGSQPKFIVCLFTRTDCPISNSYAPELRRIYEKFSPQGVGFYLIYPDKDETAPMIEKHIKDYSHPFPALRDPKHELVKPCGAKVTPEAAVFDADGKLLYQGRIDDRYVDFGKSRAAPTTRDLQQALEAILAGKPAPPAAGPAIGCIIPDVK